MKRLPPTTPLKPPQSKQEREDEFIEFLVSTAFEILTNQRRAARGQGNTNGNQGTL